MVVRGVIARSALKYGLILTLRRVVGVFITIPAAHIFGAVFYGQLVLLSNITAIVAAVATLGLQVVTFRGAGTDDDETLDATGYILCVLMPAVGLVIAGLLFGTGITVVGLPSAWLSLAILTGFLVPSSTAYLFSILRSRDLSTSFVRINLFILIVGTSLKAWLVFGLHRGVIAWLLADGLAAAIGWLMALRNRRPRRVKFSELRGVLTQGAPMIPHLLLHWVVGVLDRFLIAKFCGVADVGVYSAAYQIPEFTGSLLAEANGAYMPRYLADKERSQLREVAKSQIRLAGVATLAVAVVGPLAVQLLFPDQLAAGRALIPVLACSYFGYGLYLVAANVITLTYKTTRRMWVISGAAGLLNTALNLVLIPHIGIWGAGLATFGAFVLMALVGVARSRALLEFSFWREALYRGGVHLWVLGFALTQVFWLTQR